MSFLDLKITGPKHTYVGTDFYLTVDINRVAGEIENTYISVSGLPSDFSVSFPDIARTCCGDSANGYFLWALNQANTSVKISVPANAAVGEYTLKINFISNAVNESVEHKIVVSNSFPVYNLTYSELPPIPLLGSYNDNMLFYGKKLLGDRASVLSYTLWEGNVWYYDGQRVAYQIAAYTGNNEFNDFALNPRDVYRPYVLDNNGQIGGWRNFAQGFRMEFEKTGDLESKRAVSLLKNASYGPNGINTSWMIPTPLSREVAYAINTMLECRLIGEPLHPRFNEYLEISIGHLIQWFVDESAEYVYPFMFALTAEALIKYYEEVNKDKRILELIKKGAEWIWNKAWVENNESFCYEFKKDAVLPPGSPDLNMLIVPLYGWLYKETADKSFITMGDKIFQGGVKGAWIDQGKQFVQNYRWSMDYIKWRNQFVSANEIEVFVDEQPIEDGTTVDYGIVKVNRLVSKKIRIVNTGNKLLKISSISIPTHFRLKGNIVDLLPGASTTLTLGFLSNKLGKVVGEFVINNDDVDESVFNIPLNVEVVKKL
jgi:hypothetical protein